MKFGIFADVHANYPALQAVIELLKSHRCVKMLCLGDVVGYGPHPEACIDLIRRERIPTILGNHDEWAFIDQVIPGARENIQQSVVWTRQALSIEAKAWLRKLPRELNYAGLQLTHATNGPPGFWPYVKDRKSLAYNFQHQTHPIAFNGHTHIPAIGIHQGDNAPDFVPLLEDTYTVPPGAHVLINPGSAGQPRDGDPRAACLIYDTRTRTVSFIRVEYDIDWVRYDIRAAGLDERNGDRLVEGH